MEREAPAATKEQIAAAGYWFGPRGSRWSWGWAPVSWQGWAVVAVAVVVAIGGEIAGEDERHDALYAVPLILALVVVCLWKGTAPGPSRRATRQLQEIARRHDERR